MEPMKDKDSILDGVMELSSNAKNCQNVSMKMALLDQMEHLPPDDLATEIAPEGVRKIAETIFKNLMKVGLLEVLFIF